MRGVIWYQGEDNIPRYDYYAPLLARMVEGWREEWQQDEFPFYYCQIAPYDYSLIGWKDSQLLREQQLKAEELIPNARMAVLLDAGLEYGIHPRRKRQAGQRLALLALADTYEVKGLPDFAVYSSVEFRGDTAVVAFDRSKEWVCFQNGPRSHNFEIAGEDRRFHPAEAWTARNRVYVSSAEVKHPVAVRYAFHDWAEGDLMHDGLPVSSFRTDNWPADSSGQQEADTKAATTLVTSAIAPKRQKPQRYIPMDYSTCGYHASEQALPDVAVAAYVEWQPGDCSQLIQEAIDHVAAMRPDAQGRRGAVLLGQGRFLLYSPLRISASGVVLRGMGRSQTVLVKEGTDRNALLYIEGSDDHRTSTAADTLFVTAQRIAAGSTAVACTGSNGKLRVGERIDIVRPSTRQWIEHLGMADFGGFLDYTGWKPTDIDIRWDRTVAALHGDTIVLDAPITTTISAEYGGAYVLPGSHNGELTECGVENLSMESAKNTWNAKDEDHCWDAVWMENVRDAWVRRVNFTHFAGSAVNLQLHTSRITVEDCIAGQPVSEVGGWRRQVFHTRGQQTLFQRCLSRKGIHDFSAGFCAAGPNAFVQCEGEESLGFSGSIGSWAAGLLFDIVNIDGNDLRFANLEQFQFGTGWNTANSMFWQCTASTIWCYSPDADNRCSANGCWGTLTGNANWTGSNDHVSPRSLFYDQLEHRLGSLPVEPHLLPRPTDATSSPTPEEAMRMARQSLEQRRLGLDSWIDSIPFTASITPVAPFRRAKSKPAAPRSIPAIAVGSGHITADGLLVTGGEYDIPWWSGRVKDNFVSREARPAITRFVPGREGTGWTDRLDSVVSFLHRGHYSVLSHNYGLWYDLRRTDHERVRRADGDVWAPFYEQPFSRSGQGTAWDGLSRYDLTRPNSWYWQRLRRFAAKAASSGILLFHHHYFQHNILEAGAHWVDSPWRPVNNVNDTDFPEPVPFAGDKRIFLAEQFYNEDDSVLRPLHRQYIRMCLEEMKDQPNTVHLLSAEYTGPLHFTRFWLQTIAEWEQETGRHPLIALSCTRDAQDAIMADTALSRVVDIIDIRYWHLNTEGLWAPAAGGNLSPRQWMRKIKVGKTGFNEAYQAVRQMRLLYPDKAVCFFSQQHPSYGWAILMAGGSLPNIPVRAGQSAAADRLLHDVTLMTPMDAASPVLGGQPGYLVYAAKDTPVSIEIAPGRFTVYTVDVSTGAVSPQQRATLGSTYDIPAPAHDTVIWLQRTK